MEMAAESGLVHFKDRDSQAIRIQVGENIEEYTILKVIEFTSARKAMTMVVKRNDGRIFAFVKGADTSIIPKLSKQGLFEEETLEKMDDMAEQGLRTLLFAYKEISSIDEQSIKDLSTEYFESDLTLLGASGLEDLLQENVKQCIEDFKTAKCKVWMLTGDKGETAQNIGISCGIIDLEQQQVFKVKPIPNETELEEHLQKVVDMIGEIEKGDDPLKLTN